MSKTLKILIKKRVKFDRSILTPNANKINLIFVYFKPIFSGSKKSSTKIYLNNTSVYLKSDRFIETFDSVDFNIDIMDILDKNYISKKNVEFINLFYKINNIRYYLIGIKKKINFIDDFTWYNKFDFYHINPKIESEDVYENILNDKQGNFKYKLENTHINKNIETELFESSIKIEDIYKSLIGYNIIH